MAEKVVKSIKFSAIKAEHADRWVAVAKNTGKLLAVGDTLSEVLNGSSTTKEKTVFKVLPTAYAGWNL